MRVSISAFILVLGAAMAISAFAEDDDAAVEKRIESKVVADHEKEMSKPSPGAKAKLDAKAEQHSNSAKAATKAGGKPKVPPKKPPPKKKPVPPPHK